MSPASFTRYGVAYITPSAIDPDVPAPGLRVFGRGRFEDHILGGATPGEASGIWPEPIWRVEDMDGAKRCSGDHIPTQHRVTFTAGTIVALEPSWRWFGPSGRLIEEVAQATLALSPAALRAASALRVPDEWIRHPDDDDPLHHLSENVQGAIAIGLRTKAADEDPEAGREVMYGGGCAYIWQHTDPGWVAAELVTNAAMRAILLGDRLNSEERQGRMAPWQSLVGAAAG
jgi:hypothetical protein